MNTIRLRIIVSTDAFIRTTESIQQCPRRIKTFRSFNIQRKIEAYCYKKYTQLNCLALDKPVTLFPVASQKGWSHRELFFYEVINRYPCPACLCESQK